MYPDISATGKPKNTVERSKEYRGIVSKETAKWKASRTFIQWADQLKAILEASGQGRGPYYLMKCSDVVTNTLLQVDGESRRFYL